MTTNKHPNFLITGGTGLVGAHLLAHLVLQNKQVRAIYRPSSDLSEVKRVFSFYSDTPNEIFESIDWVEADLLDIPALQKAFENIQWVYHCAGLVSFDDKHEEQLRNVNITGTANVVNLCLANKIEKLCQVSSIATLENNKNKTEVNEESYWNPGNIKMDYAITKYGGEMEVWRGTQEGLKAVIVNPGVIFGSGYWYKNSGQMFTRIANGFKYYTNGVTGFVGVWDVVKAMVQLMESDIVSQRFILVSENLSYKTLLTEIAQQMDKPIPSKYVSLQMSKFFFYLDRLRSLITRKPALLSRQSVTTAHDKTYYNSDKIKQKLLFTFEPMQAVVKRCISDFNKKY